MVNFLWSNVQRAIAGYCISWAHVYDFAEHSLFRALGILESFDLKALVCFECYPAYHRDLAKWDLFVRIC